MNSRSKVFAITGTIIFVFTCIIGILCIKDWSGISPFAFAVILWAEIVVVAGLIIVEKIAVMTEQVFTRSSFSVLLTGYGLISIITSIIFITKYKDANTSFVIIQLVLIALLAIALLFFYTSGSSIKHSNIKTMNAIDNTEMLINRINHIAISDQGKQYKHSLNKLSEELKFTDNTEIVPEDEKISNYISIIEMELVKPEEEIATDKIQDSLVKMNSLIAQRKLTVSAMKKGVI